MNLNRRQEIIYQYHWREKNRSIHFGENFVGHSLRLESLSGYQWTIDNDSLQLYGIIFQTNSDIFIPHFVCLPRMHQIQNEILWCHTSAIKDSSICIETIKVRNTFRKTLGSKATKYDNIGLEKCRQHHECDLLWELTDQSCRVKFFFGDDMSKRVWWENRCIELWQIVTTFQFNFCCSWFRPLHARLLKP